VRDPDPRIAFGRRLRELRLERNLSQEKLAELAELHRNYVGGIERGERNVSLLNIVKLAHGLNIRTGKLVETIR
jgi:transcriptional regulator with XRE-family HTH domain